MTHAGDCKKQETEGARSIRQRHDTDGESTYYSAFAQKSGPSLPKPSGRPWIFGGIQDSPTHSFKTKEMSLDIQDLSSSFDFGNL